MACSMSFKCTGYRGANMEAYVAYAMICGKPKGSVYPIKTSIYLFAYFMHRDPCKKARESSKGRKRYEKIT